MKISIVLLVVMVSGCLPNSAIVPEYRESDAARVVVYNDHRAASDTYLEVDGMIVCRIPYGERNEVAIAPGRHRMEPRTVGAYPSTPLVVNLAAGETRYFKSWLSAYSNGFAIEEISEKDYRRLSAPFVIKSNFNSSAAKQDTNK